MKRFIIPILLCLFCILYNVSGYVNSQTRNQLFKAYRFAENIFSSHSSNPQWIALGDSFTEHNGTSLYNYTDIISSAYNLNCSNFGISGTGYIRTNGKHKAFYQRIKTIPQNAELLTIMGSVNDLKFVKENKLGNTTDMDSCSVCGCINLTLDIAIRKNPKRLIAILPPTLKKSNYSNSYIDSLSVILSKREIETIDLYHKSIINEDKTYFYDKTHPNYKGHRAIADEIANYLQLK